MAQYTGLPAKYVIHTAGPVCSGRQKDAELLADCYRNSLDAAKAHGDIHSIAFPAISCGIYGYPLDEAAHIAVDTVQKWISDNQDYVMDVTFVGLDRYTADVYSGIMH